MIPLFGIKVVVPIRCVCSHESTLSFLDKSLSYSLKPLSLFAIIYPHYPIKFTNIFKLWARDDVGKRGLQSMLWEETMSSIALNYTDLQQFVNVSFAPSHIRDLVWSSRKKHPILFLFCRLLKTMETRKREWKDLLTVWPQLAVEKQHGRWSSNRKHRERKLIQS
jgi:hypothetical protein